MWARTAGSMIAGAVGFGIGFYCGLYLVLSIWGLDADAVWYPALTVGMGSLFAGLAVALTVSGKARLIALATALAFGGVAIAILIYADAEYEYMLLAGLMIVMATSLASRAMQAAEA